jgi:hypothetical protein
MSKKDIYTRIVLAVLACIQLACLVSFSSNEEDTLAKEQTSVAQTIEALKPVNLPTLEEQPTEEPPEPAVQPTKTNTPKPCNDAQFISETIPDDSEFDAGAEFTKSWRFKNTGTCTWNTNYKLVFKSGDQMGALASKALSGDVAPGETVDIGVDMTAPASAGTYQGYWKLVDDNGDNLINNVWVKIKVKSDPFAVTSVNLVAIPPGYIGVCPFPFQFIADITTSGPGTVTYFWESSDMGPYDHLSLNFDAAGTKTVSITEAPFFSGLHWMKIYIDDPNHQYFGPLNYTVACTP